MSVPIWQISRSGLIWLLASFVVVILLHADHLPVWISPIVCFAILWQIQVFRGRLEFPGFFAKFVALSAAVVGLIAEYRTLMGLEPMVAMLSTGLSLKFLEMHKRRDAYLLIYLGYFLAILSCLFAQGIPTFLGAMVAIITLTAALMGINQGTNAGWLSPVRRASLVLMQSVPLMLLMFIVMPRLGVLWSVPLQRPIGATGVNDKMAPGDVAKLGRSGEVAFRVTFDGVIPASSEMYWRGLVLSEFDGRTWTQALRVSLQRGLDLYWGSGLAPFWDQNIERLGSPLSYRIIMEPTQLPWLFALATPLSRDSDVALLPDYRLMKRTLLANRFSYRVASWPDHYTDRKGLDFWTREQALELPQGFNPKTLRIARDWLKQTGYAEGVMQKALDYFHSDFYYTLEPPLLGRNTVDEFLWKTKRGFCEHFAGSFVFLMRAAGVPARVVLGYQGGERHPDGYVLVHQYDAHAWAEVWLEGRGWVRVDPTSAVAPERIQSGMMGFFDEDDAFLADSPFSLLRFSNVSLINYLRLKLDALDYYWATWILDYESVQQGVLTTLLGRVDPWRIGSFLFLVGGMILLPMAFALFRGGEQNKLDDIDRLYLRLCRKLARKGLPRRTGEGPRSYRIRAMDHFPEQAKRLNRVMEGYEKLRYADASGVLRRRLKEQLRKC